MIHVFRLGPFEVDGRPAWCVGGATEHGEPVRPEIEPSEVKALAAFLKRNRGQPLRCEPALADLALPLGVEPAPLPEGALAARAVLAYTLAGGPDAGLPDLDALLRFFEACAAFLDSEAWEAFGSEEALPATLTIGGRDHDREISVMGGGGQEFGVAVYDAPGSIDRLVLAVESGRLQDARRIDSLSATFEDPPAWAVDALREPFGLSRLPVALRVRKGRIASAGSAELVHLAAVLEAVTELAQDGLPDDSDHVEVTVEAMGLEVVARVGPPGDDSAEDDLTDPLPVPPPVPVSRSKTPRNSPCPCGSGRKYKKCHLAEDQAREAAARTAGPDAEAARAERRRLAERDPVHALDERITADALALACRRWGAAFNPAERLTEAVPDAQAAQQVLPWTSAHLLGPDGRTALDLYAEERGATLDDLGRRLVAAQAKAWFSVLEVTSVEAGRAIGLRDLLAGVEHHVEERTASRTLRPRDVIMARVLDLGDRAILAGCHPRTMPPRMGRAAAQLIRSRIKARGAKVSARKLRAATADATVLSCWHELVMEADAAPPPRLQNTDGEELLLTVDRFEVDPARATEVLATLATLPDAQVDEGSEERVLSFVKQGNAKGALPTTLTGRAILRDGTLRLETNSVERADRLRGLVAGRLGGLARFVAREHSDPAAVLKTTADPRRASAPAPSMPAEALAVVRRMQQEHYARWLDEAVPALDGLTPREAAGRGGAARAQLELLLAELEHHEAGQPPEQRFDVAWLRAQLGIRG